MAQTLSRERSTPGYGLKESDIESNFKKTFERMDRTLLASMLPLMRNFGVLEPRGKERLVDGFTSIASASKALIRSPIVYSVVMRLCCCCSREELRFNKPVTI